MPAGFSLLDASKALLYVGAMAKSGRELIKLESSAGTGYFYVTSKNRRTMTDKLRHKKYDPKVRKHVEFVEKKLK